MQTAKNVFNLHRPHRAFTMIELLASIAIMIILASLLFPVLKNVRGKANAIQCAGNLKQIGLGFLSYAGDYNNDLPVGSTVQPQGSWCFQISGYLGIEWQDTEIYPSHGLPVFYCKTSRRCSIKNSIKQNPLYNLSYGYNRYYYDPDYITSVTPYKYMKVKTPGNCLIASDLKYVQDPTYPAELDMSSVVVYRVGQINSISNSTIYIDRFAFRHNMCLNVLFADGHVALRGRSNDGLPADVYFGDL